MLYMVSNGRKRTGRRPRLTPSNYLSYVRRMNIHCSEFQDETSRLGAAALAPLLDLAALRRCEQAAVQIPDNPAPDALAAGWELAISVRRERAAPCSAWAGRICPPPVREMRTHRDIYRAENRFVLANVLPCDVSVLDFIANLSMRVSAVDFSVVFSETAQGLRLCVRSAVREVQVLDLAR